MSLFDGLYEITDDGRLYSKRNQKYLRPSKDKYGYMYYVISIKGKYPTLKEAAEANNISCGKASQCANGKRKGVKGLVICYE